MSSSTNRSNNEEVWRSRVVAAAERTGTIQEFCRARGISREALRYWQRKISREVPASKTPSPFSRVEIVDAEDRMSLTTELPSPAWVADLIMHLHQRCQR